MIHLHCLEVQDGFYSDLVVLDFRSKGPQFDPRLGHGNFLRVHEVYNPQVH